MIIAIALLALVLYNALVFTVFGFKNQGTKFWFSWAMTLAGAVSVVGTLVFLGPIRSFLRDWLFGFPIVRYAAMYGVLQFTASFTFMKSGALYSLSFIYASQIILIGLYWILAITCLLTKDSIKKTEQINMEKTSFIKDLRVALAALPLQTEDQPLKKKLQELSDDAKFSDPVSSELLEEVEARLLTVVTQCREALDKKDTEAALALCDKASRILKERNETCKILKRNQ
ncbi:MAG: hypothetical protein E7616_07625 [Ruminococcaceae bacterium]|nr:hypothetical protein [Oscillospiraceae bacterium]